ncbi:SHOCT domain-containing protein [Iamia sp.]|uniref:SHOCT domain-containing protein n=1 Tax=Iamia sp. TaxID=2722710 RepID=UPI002C93D7FF|nr:SHOCT domain-containing protein [Iamia sp.]HXH57707.1 SHOCT domain-containing protein [Iamia sp.]
MNELLFQGTSHDEGRNAEVYLYADRIERVKARSRASLSRANQDVEVTPMRSVSSVQTRKKGMRTNVAVYASGNNIDFRFGHSEAARFRHIITEMLLGHHVQPMAPLISQPAPTGTPAGWYPDPTGRHGQRWWGGTTWMDSVLDGSEQTTDAEGVRLMDAPTPPAASVAEQLRELAELRGSGVLTEEEFAAQKAKVLSQ